MKTKFYLSFLYKFLLLLFLLPSITTAQDDFNLIATMRGDSTGDEFDIVSYIGDVNADGYDDVIVGAPGGDYVKLYFGGEVFDTIPDLTFRDYKETNCRFGCSIAGDGDVNGDGYPDIIIGASATWIGPSCPYECLVTGAAYVYYGGPGIDTTADLTLIVGSWEESTGWNYGFGKSVTIPGDLNGDGYDDFAVGAPNDDYDAHGRVFIYYGGPNVDDQYDVLLEGEEVFDNFGLSLSAVGDINKDGFDDLLIGAPMFHNNYPGKTYQGGKAYLVYGSNNLSLTNSEEFLSDSSLYYYGDVVAGLGDVNGDSNLDFGIMSFYYFNIFSGNDFQNIISIHPAKDLGFIGGLNDLNKDGYDDFVYVSDSAKIYFGKITLDTIPNYVFPWATSVCNSGNLNKDENIEIALAVGGGWDPNGKVYIYSYGKINSIDEEHIYTPKGYNLFQNYPNPFNNSTIIRYSIPKEGIVTLSIFNIVGEEVVTLVNWTKQAGNYEVAFNSKSLTSGVYFCRLRSGNIILNNKLVLLK